MTSDAYESIKEGLEDVIAYARGDKSRARAYTVVIPETETVDVPAIRAKTGLSQSRFARSIGVATSTLQNWEQGRRRPTGPSRVLLALIDKRPQIVQELLSDTIA